MTRVRVSTTVDSDLLEQARRLGVGRTDASMVEAALEALLREHRSARIDGAYAEAFARVPAQTRDDWGHLDDFLDAAARS